MSSRRKFLKTGIFAGVGASLSAGSFAQKTSYNVYNEQKHWVWVNPKQEESEEELQQKYKKFYEAGIKGIFFEADSEKHFKAAKKQNLEAHRWMWTLNRGEKTLLESHPEWYAINRKGESCADNPPYVNYYRWLCPSREEVHEYLENDVHKILSKEYVDGIHLDYVRYCDVILPVNLWSDYGIEQTKELPEYDFCYCEICRQKFQEWRGKEVKELEFPEASLSWRLYRYNMVTKVVNKLSDVAKEYNKPITAAVFPTPEVARRIVRQDWTNWRLDGIFPMIYHGFYKEDVPWIGDAVNEGIHFLAGKFPLYAGLYLPDFSNQEELYEGIKLAIHNGAGGVSLFGDISEDVLKTLKRFA